MPHATATEIGTRELVKRFEDSSHRRIRAQRRYKIETDGYEQEALAHIADVFRTPAARTEIRKFLSLTTNVQKRMTDRIADPLYRLQPRRFLADADVEQADRYAAMLRESRWQMRAKQWVRYAFIGNVAFVVPHVREYRGQKVTRLHVIPPSIAEAIRPPDTGSDDVDPDEVSVLIWQSDTKNDRPVYQVVDSLGWYEIDGSMGGGLREVSLWDHGEVPVTPLRLWNPPPTDWWDRCRGERLPEVTIHAARVQSLLHWVRKEQGRKILVYKGEEGPPGDQTAMPEVAISTNKNPADADVMAVDYDLDPSNAIAELRFLVEQAAESMGVPSSVVDWNTPQGTLGTVQLGQIALSEVRDSMIATVEPCELDLAWRCALQMKSAGHPMAPDPAVVKEQARIQFPPLSFVDTPKARLEVYREKLTMGLITHGQILMAEEPSLYPTEEIADAKIIENIEKRNEVSRLLAEGNTPKDPDGEVKSLPEALGQVGGMKRALAEASDDEKADEANDSRSRTTQRRYG